MNEGFKPIIKTSRVTYGDDLLPDSYRDGDTYNPIDFTTYFGIMLNDGTLENSVYLEWFYENILVQNFHNAINYGIGKFYIDNKIIPRLLYKIHDWKDYIDEIIILYSGSHEYNYYFEGLDVECDDLLNTIKKQHTNEWYHTSMENGCLKIRHKYNIYWYRKNDLLMDELSPFTMNEM